MVGFAPAQSWLRRLLGGDAAVAVEPATVRDIPRIAALHAASFHRGWGEDEIGDMISAENTVVHRLSARRSVIGFAISRIAADEAEILTIAVASSHRGRGYSKTLLNTHLGYLAGRGVNTIFLEVEENNQPARRLYDKAGFHVAGRRERYYREAGGQELNALVMRRDLS